MASHISSKCKAATPMGQQSKRTKAFLTNQPSGRACPSKRLIAQDPKGGRSQEPRQKHKWRQVATNRWHEFFTHHYFLWSFAFTARLIGFKGAAEVELLNAQWKHPETLQSSFCSDKLSCCDCCSRPCWRLPESKPLMNFVMVTFIVWRPPWSAPCP